MAVKDIDDDIRWNTTQVEWRDWDAPWRKNDPFDAVEYRRKETEKLAKPKDEEQTRFALRIDYKGQHIGSLNAYHIDEHCQYTRSREGFLALGIDIKEPTFWGKGIGGKTFRMYIDYLFSKGYTELYTQTWTGNQRMIRMAERIGFRICDRKIGIREVRGKLYDGVTLKISVP
jgi:RimJ/RimL family protein N-acetyltransferase